MPISYTFQFYSPNSYKKLSWIENSNPSIWFRWQDYCSAYLKTKLHTRSPLRFGQQKNLFQNIIICLTQINKNYLFLEVMEKVPFRYAFLVWKRYHHRREFEHVSKYHQLFLDRLQRKIIACFRKQSSFPSLHFFIKFDIWITETKFFTLSHAL